MKSSFVVPDDLDPLTRHPKAAAPGERINRHNPMCFGCGERSERGLHVAMYAGEGFDITAEMLVEPWMEGGPGVIHGGLVSSAFDDVMGMLPALIGPNGVTVHLEVDFLSPIPVGRTVKFSSWILGKQRRKVFTEGIAYLDDPDKPLASAHGIFVTIDPRAHFADHIDNSAMADEHKKRLAGG